MPMARIAQIVPPESIGVFKVVLAQIDLPDHAEPFAKQTSAKSAKSACKEGRTEIVKE